MRLVTRWRRWPRTRRRAALATAAVLAVAGGAGIWPATAATTAAAPTATVAQGRLSGMVKNGVNQYLGIPYAAPPVGPLRWKPPQPAKAWTGVRQATRFGNQCPQIVGSTEDCLYLNVYQPTTPASGPRPVMVWIHGGAYFLGAASEYDPAVFARKGAVVVSINYRLGPLGFLALPSLAAESPDHASGEYGLMDQQAALRWVQQNAAAFGGDPHDVTIFGESAGGGSVCEQVASPTAAGLFQHAIAESGCALPSPSQAEADATGTAFAAKLGCTNAATAAACLRGKPVNALITHAGEYSAMLTTDWFPAWGGATLPENVLAAFGGGKANKVTMINGTNHDEGTFFVTLATAFNKVTPQNYASQLAVHFGAASVAQIEAHYPLSSYATPALALAAADTDAGMSCPTYAANQAMSAQGVPVYAYEFADPKPAGYIPGIQGAGHGSELPYVFQKIVELDITPSFDPAQRTLSDTMVGYWSTFAASGNPNSAGAPNWPAFTDAQPDYLSLVPNAIAPDTTMYQRHQCAFWLPLEANGTVNPRL